MQKGGNQLVEVKISVHDLKLQMYVSRLDKDWTESSFLFQGFLVVTQSQVSQIQQECEYVFIDVIKSEKTHKAALLNPAAHKKHRKKSFFNLKSLISKKHKSGRENTYQLKDIIKQKVNINQIVPPKKQKSFDQEMHVAKQSHSKASLLVKDFMRNVKSGGAVDMVVAKDTVRDCIDSILRSPDAMLLITRLKTQKYNVWQHSMNVSVLAISLGRYLNLNNDDLMMLGLCGMFHDIGKLHISKKDFLSAVNKKQLLESHTSLGRNILLNNMGELAGIAAEVAYSHHEHLDGSGYPRGLRDVHISAYARMIAIIDRYDNLISDKNDTLASTHYEAMGVLLENAGKHFDKDLVNSFNRCIGTYPVGSIVEMNSGEIAMVVEANETQKLRPKILLLTTSDKQKCLKKLINLADIKLDQTAPQEFYAIRGIVRPETYGIKL